MIEEERIRLKLAIEQIRILKNKINFERYVQFERDLEDILIKEDD